MSTMGSEERVRFWGAQGSPVQYLAVSVVYLGLSLWLLIGGAAQRHGTAPLITGIFMLAISIPMLVAFVGVCVRPLVIEDEVLRIPGAFSTKRVPVSDISGVGLVYRRQYRATGWRLEIWDGTGQRVPIVRFVAALPVNESDHWIAVSRTGRAAARLYAAVLAHQGSGGRLVVQAMQKTVEYQPGRWSTLAWWSPDGSRGPAIGSPPTDRPKLVDPGVYTVPPPADGPIFTGRADQAPFQRWLQQRHARRES